MTNIYPVIHYKDDKTTIAEAILAKNAKADGIFLISHNGNNDRLIPLAIEIKKLLSFKVGLNLLGDETMITAQIVADSHLDMVWADYCGVSSIGLDNEGYQLKLWAANHPDIDVFASVAFKYQVTDPNPPLAALEAKNAGFIPTTSGSGTGSAPTVEKIQSMSEAVGGLLAVASGMTCENIHQFKPYLSDVLVSTGISKDDYHFDVEKMTKFIEQVKNGK